MVSLHGTISSVYQQQPPIVGELEALFQVIPDTPLIEQLRANKRRGPKGYDPLVLWRCFIAYYYLGLPSVSDLVRMLADNPFIAQACGVNGPDAIPSQPTFSRFGSKLAKRWRLLDVKNVHRDLTRELHRTLPEFGKSVAIDSTDIKAWSHGGKKSTKPRFRQKPTDPDAGWIVKVSSEGRRKFVWGYKVHILADTKYELPIAIDISQGNLHDVNKATPLLQQASKLGIRFRPQYVICDAAYSSNNLRYAIERSYRSTPIIDPNPKHKAARHKRTKEWKEIYNRRVAVERVNSRLKSHRRLNAVRVRGRYKVHLHSLLSVIVMQARAIATGSRDSVRKVTQ